MRTKHVASLMVGLLLTTLVLLGSSVPAHAESSDYYGVDVSGSFFFLPPPYVTEDGTYTVKLTTVPGLNLTHDQPLYIRELSGDAPMSLTDVHVPSGYIAYLAADFYGVYIGVYSSTGWLGQNSQLVINYTIQHPNNHVTYEFAGGVNCWGSDGHTHYVVDYTSAYYEYSS